MSAATSVTPLAAVDKPLADRRLVAAVAKARAGLKVDPANSYLIETRLAPLARREQLPTVEALVERLRASRDEALMDRVAEAMACSQTAFFRDKAPFDAFRDELLPALAKARAGAPLRVWSVGCATGQEPYSLAMMADEAEPLLGGVRVDLFGSDLAERALTKAASGLYTQFEVQRGLPIRRLVQWFTRVDDGGAPDKQAHETWAVQPRLRQRVRWKRVNLLHDLRALGAFDVVFCRNVLSGLEETAQERVLANLAAVTRPDSVLVLGLDETVGGAGVGFRPIPGRRGVYLRTGVERAAA